MGHLFLELTDPSWSAKGQFARLEDWSCIVELLAAAQKLSELLQIGRITGPIFNERNFLLPVLGGYVLSRDRLVECGLAHREPLAVIHRVSFNEVASRPPRAKVSVHHKLLFGNQIPWRGKRLSID